jgi:hypothetical protein
MQPTELVAIMAAILYSGRREAEGRAETRQTARAASTPTRWSRNHAN